MPTLAGASTADTGASTALLTYTITNPSWTGSTTPAGHIVLLYCALRGTATFTTPSGFTAVTSVVSASTTFQLFYRITDASEGATFTVAYSLAAISSSCCASYSGADTVLIMDPAAPTVSGVAGTGTLPAPSITTTKDGDQLVWFGASKCALATDTPGTITPPAGFTSRITQHNTTGASSPNMTSLVADAVQTTHGATGAETGTTTNATEHDCALVVALAPAAGGVSYAPSRYGQAAPPSLAPWQQLQRYGLPPAPYQLENELLGGAQTARTYNTPATNATRWWMPEQPARNADPLLIQTALLEGALLGSADTARHAMWFTDRRLVPQQHTYVSDPNLLTTALLENELLGGADTMRHVMAAAYTDRREVPQQRPYVSDPLLLTTALLENELLGAGDTARHCLAAAYWDRRLMPQQRVLASDPNLLPPPGAADPTQSAWLPLWLAYSTAVTSYDRREVPQQRLYISDPSFYPSGAVTDPLTLAWGAGGNYWHLYNRAAEFTDRRLVPQQRTYASDPLLLTTALLENELLGGADAMRRYLAAAYWDRRLVPQQRAYGYDPNLLVTALLENELLGGADTARHQAPAYTDRRLVPQQRAYVSDPSFYVISDPLTLAWGAGGVYWHLYNQPADVTDRREVPQQRLLASDPNLLVPPVPLDPLLAAFEDLARRRRMPATHWDRRLYPAQRLYYLPPPPPPLLVPGTGISVVTDPREGASTVSDPREGVRTVTDPREGTMTVTDPRDGIDAVTDPRDGRKGGP